MFGDCLLVMGTAFGDVFTVCTNILALCLVSYCIMPSSRKCLVSPVADVINLHKCLGLIYSFEPLIVC